MAIYTPAQIQEITAPIKLIGKCFGNTVLEYLLHFFCFLSSFLIFVFQNDT